MLQSHLLIIDLSLMKFLYCITVATVSQVCILATTILSLLLSKDISRCAIFYHLSIVYRISFTENLNFCLTQTSENLTSGYGIELWLLVIY